MPRQVNVRHMTKAHGGAMMTKMIPLSQGKFAKVDDCDYDRISKHKWSVSVSCAIRMSYVTGKAKSVLMHREIMSTPDGMETDHINGDRLDNRRANLRICTHGENQQNRRAKIWGGSGYKGVCWITKDKKWRAQIKVGGRVVYIGQYDNPKDAAIAYNKEAEKYFGEYARLNNIEQG